MAWTAPSDHGATIVSQAEWNAFHGTAGNCAYLKALADLPMKAQKAGGSIIGGRNKINIIEGGNITATVADDAANDRINITLASSALAVPTQAESLIGGATYRFTVQANTGTANTMGTWVELIASTSFAATYLVLQITATNGETFLVNIGTGAGPTVLIPNIYVLGATGKQDNFLIPISIPAGTSIHAQCQTDDTGGSDYVYISGSILG